LIFYKKDCATACNLFFCFYFYHCCCKCCNCQYYWIYFN